MADITNTGTVGSAGTPANGNGASGGSGGLGGDAGAVANTADTSNTASATGGAGGAGADGNDNSSPNQGGGRGGLGGDGGDAAASATTTTASSAGNSATAEAGGGNGGAGGIGGAPNGLSDPGGSAGNATATAKAVNTQGSAIALAVASGGTGGTSPLDNFTSGSSNLYEGGAGGVAHGTTASAVGTTEATAEVFQDGGNGGAGVASGPGAGSTLSNAVSGATTGGILELFQRAEGGSAGQGGDGSTLASQGVAGGNAVSNLTTTDTTSTVINVFVGAIGAEGGNDEEYYTDQQLYGFGLHGNPTGDGGNAEASANITGTDITTGFGFDTNNHIDQAPEVPMYVTVQSNGGNGALGGSATSTAVGTAGAGTSVDVEASAYGGDGPTGGAANATATATGGTVNATALADGGPGFRIEFGDGTIGGTGTAKAKGIGTAGAVTAAASTAFGSNGGNDENLIQVSANAPVYSDSNALAVAADGTAIAFDSTDQAVATASFDPSGTTLPAGDFLLLATEQGGGNFAKVNGAATISSTVSANLDVRDLGSTGGELLMGFRGVTLIGNGVTGVTFSVTGGPSTGEVIENNIDLSKTFASGAAAEAYFATAVVDLGPLNTEIPPTAVQNGETVDITYGGFTISLTETIDQPGSGLYENSELILGTPGSVGPGGGSTSGGGGGAVTLHPGTAFVTINTAIDTFGVVGTYGVKIGGSIVLETIGAALFGPPGTDFTVLNNALIESDATGVFDAGVVLAGPDSLVNAGNIIGASGIEVFATAVGAYVENNGSLRATLGTGIYLQGPGSGLNTGQINATGDGIRLGDGGYGYNSGAISAANGIVVAGGSSNYVYNIGHISASADGIVLQAAGSASNAGIVQAGGTGLLLNAGGIAYNYGLITAATGVNLAAGGDVVNDGTIDGTRAGIVVAAGGTVTDRGVLAGGSFAVSFTAGFDNKLIIDAGSHLSGTVFGGGGVLGLAADGKKTGTIALANGQYEDFGTIDIAAKSIWDFAGTFTASSAIAIVNNGTITEAKSDLATFDGAISGKGTIAVSKQELTLNGSVAADQKIMFSGTGETLALGDATGISGAIKSFGVGDTIDLTGISPGMILGTKFSKGVLTLRESTGSIALIFASPASFGSKPFSITQDGSGTAITLAKTKASDMNSPYAWDPLFADQASAVIANAQLLPTNSRTVFQELPPETTHGLTLFAHAGAVLSYSLTDLKTSDTPSGPETIRHASTSSW